MKRFLLAALACVTMTAHGAQFAIVGAKLHTMSEQGTLEEATILIKDGYIQDVLKGSQTVRGYEPINAKGKVVTPGLIGAYTALGLKKLACLQDKSTHQ